jgi:hypothetical protein
MIMSKSINEDAEEQHGVTSHEQLCVFLISTNTQRSNLLLNKILLDYLYCFLLSQNSFNKFTAT